MPATESNNLTTIKIFLLLIIGSSRGTGSSANLKIRACLTNMNATVIKNIETKKCAMFEYGFKPVRTTTAPINTCARTPTTSTKDIVIKSLRRGESFIDNKTQTITATATTPVKRRFNCSIAECVDDTSINLSSLHFGQSAQPRPEPVNRTSEPVMMIA